MKTYRHKRTIKAKLFEFGDEEGITCVNERSLPYITNATGYREVAVWGQSYLCILPDGNKFLISKELFERTYEEIPK
jgi:hypothetical protein